MQAIFVTEAFRSESLQFRADLPGIGRQARFAAGLLEKSLAIPTVLDGHLG